MTYTAFADHTKKISSGDLVTVAKDAKTYLSRHAKAQIFIFDDSTSQQIEIDFRGGVDDVEKRVTKLTAPEPERSGPGRPKLGVVAKEVTLLPQHWEWLAAQPGGASVTLRKLVDSARKKNSARDEMRRAQEAVYKFLLVMAGDRPHYEEVLRALYAQDKTKFKKLMEDWPKDVREHASKLSLGVF